MSLSFSNVKANLGGEQPLEMVHMMPVRQHFPSDSIEDVGGVLRNGLASFETTAWADKHIAITAGSRGIKGIAGILRETVEVLKAYKAHPFIVPAMGSHGGATAQGQIAVLERLGITEVSIGAPIRSSMDVVQLGTTKLQRCVALVQLLLHLLLLSHVSLHLEVHIFHLTIADPVCLLRAIPKLLHQRGTTRILRANPLRFLDSIPLHEVKAGLMADNSTDCVIHLNF